MERKILTPKQVVSDPLLFANAFLKIQDKDKKLVRFRWNKAQQHFHFNRTNRDIILKARQLGFSTYLQGELFRRVVTRTSASITLAHDSDTTTKLRLMADRFYENCKFGTIQPERKYANASLATYPEYDSAATIATAGSVDTGRGDTYTDIHGSEVAFWPDAEKIIRGAMQGGNPQAALESTPNGAQGYFFELCMEAMRGDGVWKLHFYPWWWDEAYQIINREDIKYTDEEKELVAKHGLIASQIKWRRNKVKELKRFFIQEYPESIDTCFLTSGNSYFGDLTGVFDAPLFAEYNENHAYYAGLDFGQSNDYSAMPVFDKTANVQVDLLHMRKLPWAEQRSRIVSMYKKWHCSKMGAEENSIGSPNIEALQENGLNIVPFTTSNASKAEIMSRYYEAIHAKDNPLKLQDASPQRQEMNSFIATQTSTNMWRLEASKGSHDDTVMAGAICLWVMDRPSGLDLVDFA